MRRVYLLVIAASLVVSLSLAACAPGWGQFGPGGMMGNQGGMMGGQGGQNGMMAPGGMMGSGMMSGMPMMGGMMGYYSGIPAPLSHDDAKTIADRYLASLNNPDLSIAEFEEYSHNFYVSLIEKSTGRGAIEVIIDRYNGSLQPEPQGMMWNSKYGMMGSYQQNQMSVTQQQAMKIAQDFLDRVYPGTKADEIVAYYGHYTIMTTLAGKHYGMLSINGYSGDIWYHIWHGMFIAE
ncbi:MAG: peptidase M4 [Chloroflexi bacterium]|nr:peptidase M4 [Chloroflexota bacterium]